MSDVLRKRQRWTITREWLDLLLSRLDPDPNTAAERFQNLHAKLTALFTYERCVDAERWADETLDRAAKRLSEGLPVDDLPAFVRGIARFVLQEAHKEEQREREARRSVPMRTLSSRDSSMAVLEACLKSLSNSNRTLIERYYGAAGDKLPVERAKLAKDLGVSIETLRTRALRIRKDLEACVGEGRESTKTNVIHPEFPPLHVEEEQ